jgi:hypothetical protein
MTNPNIQKSSPQTFGDLYTQIQEKNILTPEEENVFRDRAMQKYGMMGLLAKRQEAIGSNTRNELSWLLTGLPERDQILAKLDSMLPGYTPTESGQKITEQAKNTPKNIPSTPDIGSDLVKSLDGSVPAVTATIAGLGAAVVGTGLVTEKWWKTTLVENFGKFKDWIVGLLPENGIFAGLKDGIMKVFAKIGWALGIKSKEKQSTNDRDIDEVYNIRGIKAAKDIFTKIKVAWKAPDSALQPFFTNPKLLALNPDEARQYIKEYSGKEDEIAAKLWFEKSAGKLIIQTLSLYISPDCTAMLKDVSDWDIQKQSLAISFAHTWKYMQFIDHMKLRGESINIEDVSFRDALPTSGDIKEFVWNKKEMLDDLHTRFKWFTPNVLNIVNTHYSERLLTEKIDYTPYEKDFSHGEWSEWEFLNQKLPEYAKLLPDMLRTCAFGNPDALALINKNLGGLKQKDLISFFIMSWWRTDTKTMNSWEKAQVVMRLALMLRANDKSEGYQYMMLLWGDVIGKWESMKMPPEVKSLINDGMGLLFKGAKLTLDEGTSLLSALVKQYPWFTGAGAATIAWILCLAIQFSPIVRVTWAFFFLLKVLGISALAFGAYAIANDGSISKDGKKMGTLEDIAKSIPDPSKNPKI